MSTPQSGICIASVPAIDNRYEHTLYFSNEQEQRTYFEERAVKQFTGYTYLRRNWSIKVEVEPYTSTASWQYLFFHNQYGKLYYYFINKVTYLNDHTVELDLELDVIQTYMFDWHLPSCFVERTHTTSDNFGEHTMEEGLETGPLIDGKVINYTFNDLCILVLSTVDSDVLPAYANVYDGVFSGLLMFVVELDDADRFGTFLERLNDDGKIDGIVSMWMYPKELIHLASGYEWGDGSLVKKIYGTTTWVTVEVNGVEAMPTTNQFQGYVPANRKLFCYPYSFLYLTNNLGGSAIFRNERFNDPNEVNHKFLVMGGLAPDSGVKCLPKGYNGNAEAFDEGLSMGSFPTCAWDSDTYKVWLAQNQNTQDLAIKQSKITALTGGIASVAGAVMGNVTGAVGGLATAYHAYNQVQGIMAQRADMDVQPSQARGNQSANLNLANGKHGFSFHYKFVTKEYAQSIDEYFTRYGYRVARIMEPVLKARKNFTYIKTVGCMVGGEVPMEDRQKIASVFDNGITFWADKENVGSYNGYQNT